jgi:hypothetical protein
MANLIRQRGGGGFGPRVACEHSQMIHPLQLKSCETMGEMAARLDS